MSFFDRLTEELKDLGTSIGEWVPRIIGALIILIVGWFIAKWVRRIVRRLLDNDRVRGFFDRIGIGEALRNAGYSAPKLVATAIYGFLMLVVLLITSEALELSELSDLLRRLVAFLPQIFIAVVIVMIAAAVGRFLADLARPWADSREMSWVPSAIQVGLLLFGIITALDLLNIGVVTNSVLTAVLGGAGIAFAIAFGVGGIDTAKQWWARYASPKTGSSV
jgi:hypothetical protein